MAAMKSFQLVLLKSKNNGLKPPMSSDMGAELFAAILISLQPAFKIIR
jgi:hypothetical protein